MKNKNYAIIIGNNIQKARLKKGLTQEFLAEKCNVTTKYISAIERGVSLGSISIILDICKTLDITPNYIFNNICNFANSKDELNIMDSETSVKYLKLKPENKDFVKATINHLYSIQTKRYI